MSNGLRPEDVFTPRAAAVNPKTYISRPDLEKSLGMALRMPKHIVIHGESGTGKTWLYKKVLGDLGYYHEVANMGLCSGAGSIADVLRTGICREIKTSTEQTRTVDGGIPAIAKVGVEHIEKTHKFHDPLLEAMSAIRVRAGERQACLIFDNLEQVTQRTELVNEIAGYLLLVDDQRYADKDVKILLVGTSNEIRSLISQIRTSGPVANRITEIPEVSRLSEQQACDFADNGFFGLLGCEVENDSEEERKKILSTIAFYSDRIPLHIQDLCFFVACNAESNGWRISAHILIEALKEWIKSSLVADVSRVQNNLNAIATKIGRRNQVLYCLGKQHKYDFNVADIEATLKSHFPISSKGVALNIAQILSDLAKSDHPVIKRNPNSNHYRFIDPKYRIVVRWLLVKLQEPDETIALRDFDNALGLWNQ